MEKWKKISKKLLFPPVWLIVILTALTAIFVPLTFILGWDETPVAYGIYVVAFYAVTVLTLYLSCVLPKHYRLIRQKIYDTRLGNRYMTDTAFKVRVSLIASLSINLVYVISKTLVCFVGGSLMILAFFGGTMLGGAIAGLPFAMEGFGVGNLVMCILSKLLVVLVFVPIYLTMSVIGKQKLWLSMVLSFMTGMLLFMMIPMLTPLDATIMNVLLCLIGSALISVGLGAVSNLILKKTSLV